MLRYELIDFNSSLWESCIQLYTKAFPANERREPDELLKVQGTEGYKIQAIIVDNVFAGFIESWMFFDFIFLEHIAILPEKQGQGIGTQVMLELSDQPVPVILEAEPPTEFTSESRIKFYRNCGFAPVNIDYTQPPYYPGKSSVPMVLLSNKPVTKKDAGSYIRIISRNVYKTG